MPADRLQADWAAQRIKNLSLATAIRNALLPRRRRTDVTSLIEEFQYPKYGPGMMWERCAEQVRTRGGQLTTGTWVTAVHRDPARQRAISVTVNGAGGQRTEAADHVISSMPISELVAALHPPAPPEVLACAADLRYRDFLTVALVVPAEFSFPDNWIYVHDPGYGWGGSRTSAPGRPTWSGRAHLPGAGVLRVRGRRDVAYPDADLVALATAELERLGLVRPGVVEAGYVVRMPKAYPVYDERYQHNVEVIRAWLAEAVPNVHPVGRNGMHRYNNQDHSMLTAMLTAENIATGSTHDVWSVNVEQDYHEQSSGGDVRRGSGRDAPVLPAGPSPHPRGRCRRRRPVEAGAAGLRCRSPVASLPAPDHDAGAARLTAGPGLEQTDGEVVRAPPPVARPRCLRHRRQRGEEVAELCGAAVVGSPRLQRTGRHRLPVGHLVDQRVLLDQVIDRGTGLQEGPAVAHPEPAVGVHKVEHGRRHTLAVPRERPTPRSGRTLSSRSNCQRRRVSRRSSPMRTLRRTS
ncbi:hypothetical protein NKG94_11520 [Micromonospora sp. M12]